jgi:hypothetical protein
MTARVVNPATGHVSREALDLVRGPVATFGGEVAAAVATYDAAVAIDQRLRAEGHAAHRQPVEARQVHHALIVAAVLAGDYPDDEGSWDWVLDSDRRLELCQTRVAGAADAIREAARALGVAFGRCWPAALPWVAAHRGEPAATVLAYTFGWPALVDAPGVEEASTVPAFHFRRWWPLHPEPLDRSIRSDRRAWEEWCWGVLANERYEADVDAGSITLHNRWAPEGGSLIGDNPDGVVKPVVFVTTDRVAAYEHSLAQQR